MAKMYYEADADMSLIKDKNIGIIAVTPAGNRPDPTFHTLVEPMSKHINDYSTSPLMAALHDEQKEFSKAGNSDGKRWTPFSESMKSLLDYVRINPGEQPKYIVPHISHHWPSDRIARNMILKLARTDDLTGFRAEHCHGNTHLFAKVSSPDGD